LKIDFRSNFLEPALLRQSVNGNRRTHAPLPSACGEMIDCGQAALCKSMTYLKLIDTFSRKEIYSGTEGRQADMDNRAPRG
jgi:hypothetical protein